MTKIIKLTQDELNSNTDLFEICNEIYLDKFYLEDEFTLDDISGLVFYFYYLDDIIIGFGSHQNNNTFYLIETIFFDEYMYTDIQKELASHIISDIKSMDDKLICAYQADEKDRDFYFDLGFTLYKDFAIQSPGMFNDGFDQTRFVLELR